MSSFGLKLESRSFSSANTSRPLHWNLGGFTMKLGRLSTKCPNWTLPLNHTIQNGADYLFTLVSYIERCTVKSCTNITWYLLLLEIWYNSKLPGKYYHRVVNIHLVLLDRL